MMVAMSAPEEELLEKLEEEQGEEEIPEEPPRQQAENYIEEEEPQETPTDTYSFGKYYCPKGDHYTPFFVMAKPTSPVVRCPVCGATIGRKQVPEQSIIIDSEIHELIRRGADFKSILLLARTKGYIPDSVEDEDIMDMVKREEEMEESIREEKRPAPRQDSGEDTEERRDREGTPLDKLFRRPKHPCEVLQEVLNEFKLKSEFVTAMVRRCQRAGGLHPVELLHYLTTMKSGVKTQGEAQFIAEEYAAALREEMEKARQLNMPYPSIGITEPAALQGTVASPGFQRLLQILPPNGSTTPPSYGSTSPSVSPGFQTPGARPQPSRTPGQVANMQTQALDITGIFQGIAALLNALNKTQPQQQQTEDKLMALMFQMLQKQQEQTMQLLIQQQRQQIEELAKQLGTGLQELGRSFAESIKELSKLVESTTKQRQADPELLYKAAKAEAEKEYLEKLLKLKEEETKKLTESLSELEKKIYEVIMTASKPAGEFQSDEAKLVATALQQATALGNKLVDILDKRQPIKIIVEALPTLMQAQGAGKVPEKYRSTETKAGEAIEVIEELEKLGLVEEENE